MQCVAPPVSAERSRSGDGDSTSPGPRARRARPEDGRAPEAAEVQHEAHALTTSRLATPAVAISERVADFGHSQAARTHGDLEQDLVPARPEGVLVDGVAIDEEEAAHRIRDLAEPSRKENLRRSRSPSRDKHSSRRG